MRKKNLQENSRLLEICGVTVSLFLRPKIVWLCFPETNTWRGKFNFPSPLPGHEHLWNTTAGRHMSSAPIDFNYWDSPKGCPKAWTTLSVSWAPQNRWHSNFGFPEVVAIAKRFHPWPMLWLQWTMSQTWKVKAADPNKWKMGLSWCHPFDLSYRLFWALSNFLLYHQASWKTEIFMQMFMSWIFMDAVRFRFWLI